MSTKRIEVDPSGDTLVILPKKNRSHGYSASTQIGSSDSLGSQPELHFLCSKKHLTLASRRADKIFTSGFKEAMPDESDGLHHWKFEAIFDPEAFEIMIKVIHGKNRDIPRTVNTELLAGISAIVDDLECHDNVWFFAKGWLLDLRYVAPPIMCKEVAQVILISFVFNDPILFEASAKTAITSNLSAMPTFGLPIRPKVLRRSSKSYPDS